jgi:hypothetical protein
VTGFQRGDIVFKNAAEPHHFEGVGAQRFLVMIPEGDEEKEAGEKSDDDNSNSRPGQEFEMKMLGAEKPGGAAANQASTNLGFLGYVGLRHYKFHKANSLPWPRGLQARPGEKQA